MEIIKEILNDKNIVFKNNNKINSIKNIAEKIDNYAINRYPLLALIGYVIAKRNNCNEIKSRSLGLGLATQYASWRNTYGNYKSNKGNYGNLYTNEEKFCSEDGILKENVEFITFCGEALILKDNICQGGAYRKKLQVSNPDKFQSKVINAFNSIKPNLCAKLCKKISDDLNKSKENYYTAINGRRFMNYWKKVRDEYRNKEFLESL